jgi:hypothetical protein
MDEQILIKYDIWEFYEKFPGYFISPFSQTILTATLHEHKYFSELIF